MVICPYCGKQYCRQGISTHIWRTHTKVGKKFKPTPVGTKPWNTGLTKDEHPSIAAYAAKSGKKNSAIRKGTKLSEKTKRKVSRSMKKAHKEGRAWNIGNNRRVQKQSYPEKFFTSIIKTEFKDIAFVPEYQFMSYRFDFAWPHLMKEIEIDGSQHFATAAAVEHDKIRDRRAKAAGWKVLRIKWTDMYHNPGKYIKIAKEFIDGK